MQLPTQAARHAAHAASNTCVRMRADARPLAGNVLPERGGGREVAVDTLQVVALHARTDVCIYASV
eukprot:1223151-Alexandrium_andersonii.AAC.1